MNKDISSYRNEEMPVWCYKKKPYKKRETSWSNFPSNIFPTTKRKLIIFKFLSRNEINMFLNKTLSTRATMKSNFISGEYFAKSDILFSIVSKWVFGFGWRGWVGCCGVVDSMGIGSMPARGCLPACLCPCPLPMPLQAFALNCQPRTDKHDSYFLLLSHRRNYALYGNN